MPSVAAVAPARSVTPPPTYLHHCLRRLADGSRTPTPEGSLPACAWEDVATPIRSITDRLSLAPSSFTRCPIRSSYDSLAVHGRQDNGLTTFRRWNHKGGLGRVSSPVV